MPSRPKRKVTSLDSTSSVSSTSSQRLSGNRDVVHEYATTAAVTTSYSKNLSDISAILIHCPKHEKFALAHLGSTKGYWLPYVSLKQSESWYSAVVNKLRQLLRVRIGIKSSTIFTPPELLHIMRIQLPQVLKYVTRVVFMTNLLSLPVSSPSNTNSSAIKQQQQQQPPPSASSGTRDTNSPKRHSSSTSSSTGSHDGSPTPPRGTFQCMCESKDTSDIDGHGSLRWLTHEAIVADEEALEIWGPEPGIFTSAFATRTVEKGAYSEYTLREAIKYLPRETPRCYQEEMLSSCHFEQDDILRLYSDYVQHCFPSQNMNYNSFRDYMLKLGYEPLPAHASSVTSLGSNPQHALLPSPAAPGINVHDFRSLYRAFKLNKNQPYVTFHELLLGLAAMDRSTAHGAHVGELRCAYIFRYYDSNGDGKLSAAELKTMAMDRLRIGHLKQVHTALKHQQQQQQQQTQQQQQQQAESSHSNSRSVSGSSRTLASAASTLRLESDAVAKELANIYRQLQLKPSESINELNFMLAVGSMQLRGTSGLFRSQVSVLPVKQYYDTIAERQALTDIEGNLIGTEIHRKGTCPRCKEKRYTLALHTVKMTHDAQIVEPTEVRFDEYPAPISRAQRQQSRIVFASDSTPNKLIDMISGYWNSVLASQLTNSSSSSSSSSSSAASNGQLSSARMMVGLNNAVPLGKTSWDRIDRQTLADDIKRVCAQADAIFRHEPRVVGVTSPCFVLGDIHGNLNDLRAYERILWPNAPACVAGSYLFLGDYVDRGDYGLECICYLLSMKVLAPKTFFLLRGNHEVRSIQQAFTFFREVCDKFRNQQLGVQVWETLNRTFDLMPIAATIDDQIYCAHGGIPTSATRLDELYSIPSPLSDPENQSAPAWEMLWNDPVSSTEYSEYADLLRKQPGGQQAVASMAGFLPNTKRGTAFFFSEEAVKRFLHFNNMSHIIRAHECVSPGYALHCNGRVITIFSSSHYCGATNDAACVLVEREKLRIIRLDTD